MTTSIILIVSIVLMLIASACRVRCVLVAASAWSVSRLATAVSEYWTDGVFVDLLIDQLNVCGVVIIFLNLLIAALLSVTIVQVCNFERENSVEVEPMVFCTAFLSFIVIPLIEIFLGTFVMSHGWILAIGVVVVAGVRDYMCVITKMEAERKQKAIEDAERKRKIIEDAKRKQEAIDEAERKRKAIDEAERKQKAIEEAERKRKKEDMDRRRAEEDAKSHARIESFKETFFNWAHDQS